MIKLKKAGFFFEIPKNDFKTFSSTNLEEAQQINRESILSYLDRGVVYGVIPMAEHDILNPGDLISPSLTLMTDGVWVWPSSLAYYIRKHGATIPDDFFSRMKQMDYLFPSFIFPSGDQIDEYVDLG